MTTLFDVATSLWLVFVIVSLLFYVVTMIALVYNRQVSPFNSSFFTLWIFLGVIDCSTTIANWMWRNPPTLQWWYYTTLQPVKDFIKCIENVSETLQNGTLYLWNRYYGMGSYIFFAHAQYAGVVLLCLNRLTSIIAPMKHKAVACSYASGERLVRCLQLWSGWKMALAAVAPYCTSTAILVLYMYAKVTGARSYSLMLANINMLAMTTIGGTAQVST